MKRYLASAVLAGLLVLPAVAQDNSRTRASSAPANAHDGDLKDDVRKGAGKAGRETVRTAERTGRVVKKGSKKVVHKAAGATEKGAAKVRRSTGRQ
jgi:hypothetical protein